MNQQLTVNATSLPQRVRAVVASRYFWLAALLALLLIGGFIAWRVWANAQNASTPVASAAIEARWGVRVTQVGVSGDGGLIDFRFIVVDPDKALAMLEDVKNVPVLIAEDSGAVVNATALMAHRNDLKPGRTYFLLYRNTGGAIQRGTLVSVLFGDLRLEHIRAK